MKQLLERTLSAINVDYAEVRIEQTSLTTIVYQGPKLEKMSTVLTLGGSVRACVKGGWGFAAFTRLDDALDAARDAEIMARLSSRDRTVLAPVPPVDVDTAWKGGTHPRNISLEEKRDLIKDYNDRMLAADGIVTTNAVYRDVERVAWILTSDGGSVHRENVYSGVSLSAVAKDGANVQRGRKSIGDQRGYENVLGLEDEVDTVIKNTHDLIRAPKVTGGCYDVILDPELAGVFAHEAFGHLSEADFIYENPQARDMMKLGRRFGPDFLNIIDDGGMTGENGDMPYDDEAVAARKTDLLKDGILVGRLHSRETAGKMEEEPTGNARAIDVSNRPIVRMTSTYIDNGDTPFDEIIGEVKDGIYACGFLGGMTDMERFTFSSAHAYRIENGRITEPVRDVILSGNLFETMHNITAIGDDIVINGGLGGCGKGGQSPLPVSDGSPHIRIKDVLVG